MKVSKTVKGRSSILPRQTHSSFSVIEAFLRKHSDAGSVYEPSRYREVFPHRNSYHGDLVTVASYAHGANKSIAQAASDIMELVNDGDLKYVASVGFNHFFEWTIKYSHIHDSDGFKPVPANLMSDLDELRKVDAIADCGDVELQTSVEEYLMVNVGHRYGSSNSQKERNIILADLVIALFNEIQDDRISQDKAHLISKVKELNYCYTSTLEMKREVRKHRASKQKKQSCYAYYDLKQSPPKFIGLGITSGDPHAFINKTLKHSIGLMRQFELEFDVRPVDDRMAIKEINRLAKEYKPYTKFLLAYNGNFYASERFSTAIFGIEDPDKTSFLSRNAPVKVKTELLAVSDFIWKWENRPRVIIHYNALWNSQPQEDPYNPSTSQHRYTDDEIRALNTNYYILSQDMTFSDIPNSGGVDMGDIFTGGKYSLENGHHVIRHSHENNSLEIKLARSTAYVSTVVMTDSGKVDVSAKLSYSDDEVEYDKPLYWVELYALVKMFIASPSPLKFSWDIYLPPGKKHSERDVLEGILRYNFTFHTGNVFKPFYFDVEMIDKSLQLDGPV